MLTSLRVVLREHSDVAALPHVAEALTAYLDNLSTKWTVAAAAERGFVHLLTYLAERQAAQEPDFPELLFNMDDPLIRAARHGHLDVMRWLLEYRPDDLIPPKAMDVAAEGGHLEIVKWLHDHDRAEGCTKQAMDSAAGNGHLEVVQWLHENRTEGCTDAALNRAAAGGHLEVVQFLVAHRQEGNVTEAMVHAAQCGRLEVLRWLGETLTNKWSVVPDEFLTVIQWLGRHEARVSSWRSTFNAAAAGGHLNVIVWLMENGITYCTADAMNEAARNGHLETVRWLHENRTEGCTTMAMDSAAARGHLEVVRFLHENRSEGCTAYAMHDAAVNGHLEVVKFLHDHRSEGPRPETMKKAALRGHLHIIQWLHANRPSEVWSSGGIGDPPSGGHLGVLEWLDENRPEQLTGIDVNIVARNGDVPVMTYMLTRFPDSFNPWANPIRTAIDFGHLEIVKLIHNMVPQHPVDPTEVACAARGGHLELVQWLYEHRSPTATCSPRAMNEVAGNGHLATLRWLIEHKGYECTTGAIDRAARGGHLEVIRYLFRNRHAGCTARAMEHAVGESQARVVKWLIANCPEKFYNERALKAAIKTARRRSRRLIEAWLAKSLDDVRSGIGLSNLKWGKADCVQIEL